MRLSFGVRLSLLGLFGALGSFAVRAVEIPLRNWTPPANGGGITTQSDITNPLPFIGLPPCRILDTRGNGAPITGGKFAGGENREYILPGICGIPVTAKVISLNVTATETNGLGFLSVYPNGIPFPGTSTLNYTTFGVTIANAAIVPLGSSISGIGITVTAGVSGAHVVIDTNGYFSSTPGSGYAFGVTANDLWAITGINHYNDNHAIGVGGRVVNPNTDSAGVLGQIGSPFSVLGCCGPAGVRGEGDHVGTLGLSHTIGSAGRLFDTNGNVLAGGDLAVAANAVVAYGVQGISLTSNTGSAGVRGVDHSGDPAAPGFTCCGIAGVRGLSVSHTGVDGVSRDGVGVVGWNKDGAGTTLAWGALGASDNLGIAFANGIAGTGTKSFVEPHPTDASKAIRYVSLEGNEAGTYFRGRGKFERGLARIAVPEDFRIVTDPDGLTVQITPIGEMASYAVVRADLNEIMVKASRNVEFFYAVNGVRRAYKNWQPIVSSEEFFVPESADEKLPLYFGEEERRRLITNGTYSADGAVNMETAERLGWTRIWAERKKNREASDARNRETQLPDNWRNNP
jgi:hypothetical protein